MRANDHLTTREKEVLATLFDLNMDVQATAEKLSISVPTVRSHLHQGIFPKLRVNCMAAAFRVALGLGILNLKTSLDNYPPDLFIERGFSFGGSYE